MVSGMIRSFLILAVAMTVVSASGRAAGSSAYPALRIAQKAAGNSATLVESIGQRGEPRPQEWKFIFSDPGARGGIREISVADDAVVSQRTPIRGYTGASAQPAVSLSRLNLDSDAAFEIANKQAIARQVGFQWVNYTLRANNVTGMPMWVVQLYNHMGVRVGVVQISAENGEVIMPLEVAAEPPLDSPRKSGTERKIGGLIGTVGATAERVGTTVRDGTLRAVGTVEEVLTGERTIGPKEENE